MTSSSTDVVLHENILLSELECGIDQTSECVSEASIASLLAYLFRGSGAAASHPAPTCGLVLSEDEQFLAILLHRELRLLVLSRPTRYQEVLWSHQMSDEGNQGVQRWLSCTWSEDNSRLAAVTSCSVHVLDSQGTVLWRCTPSSGWVWEGYVGAAFVNEVHLVLLTTRGRVVGYDTTCGAEGRPVPGLSWSVRRYHPTPWAVQYHSPSRQLVVLGEGPTTSLWSVGNGSVSLKRVVGDPGRRGLMASLLAPFISSYPTYQHTHCYAAFSPLGEYLAVCSATGGLTLISLVEGKVVEAERQFAHHKAPPANFLLAPSLADSITRAVCACWWGSTSLAVADINGAVGLVRLPGYSNMLGAQPERFSPGCQLACCLQGPRGILVVDPLVQEGAQEVHDTSGLNVSTQGLGSRRGMCAWSSSNAWTQPGGQQRLPGKVQLWLLAERSPSEMVQVYIRQEDWGSALQVARAYGLELDIVYRARWSSQPVSAGNISDNLAKMVNRHWVVEECSRRVANTYEDQRRLLQYGLKETARALRPSAGGASGPTTPYGSTGHLLDLEAEGPTRGALGLEELGLNWWHLQRLELWRQVDLLETYFLIRRRSYDADGYALLRGAPLLAVAMGYAGMGHLAGLQMLLERHPLALAPHVLQMLSALPEVVDPMAYLALLPQGDGSVPLAEVKLRAPDWVECQEVRAALEGAIQAGGVPHDPTSPSSTDTPLAMVNPVLTHCTENFIRLGSPEPKWPASDQVVDWYESRAVALDEVAGQLPLSVALLECAQQRGVTSAKLEKMLTMARALSGAVGARGPKSWALSLSTFLVLEPFEQLMVLVESTSVEQLGLEVESRLVPYLTTQPAETQVPLLYDMVLSQFSTRLPWCVALINEECSRRQLWQDVGMMTQAVLSAVAGADQQSDWQQIDEMLQVLLAHLSEVASDPSHEDHEVAEGLQQSVLEMRGFVRAAWILGSHGVTMTIRELTQVSADEAIVKVRAALGGVHRPGASWSSGEWSQLWEEMEELRRGAFPFLDQSELLKEFVQVVLRAGKNHLAWSYLTGGVPGVTPLSGTAAAQVVVDVSMEMINSAPSLDSDELEQGLQCLMLVGTSPRAQQIVAMVEALRALPRYNVYILPAEVAQMNDRMEVLRRVFSASPSAYRDLNQVLAIAQQLGLNREDQQCQVRLLAATSALNQKDLARAQSLCLDLVATGYRPAWTLARQLAQHPNMTDRLTKVRLAAFALAHCDDSPHELGAMIDIITQAQDTPTRCAEQEGGTKTVEEKVKALWSPVAERQPLASVPTLGPVPELTNVLLTLSTAQQLLGLINQLAQEATYGHLQRLYLVGTYSCCAQGLLELEGGATKPPDADYLTRLYSLLSSPLPDLHQHLCAQHNKGTQPEAVQVASVMLDKLKLLEDSRAVRQVVGDILPAQFVSDSDYRSGAVLRLASAAGSMYEEGKEDMARGVVEQAREMAQRYRLDLWLVNMEFVKSLLLHSPAPLAALRQQVLDLERDLLAQPAEFLIEVYQQVYLQLPGTDTLRMTYIFGLLLDGLHAYTPSIPGHALVASITSPLGKLKDSLEKGYRAFKGLDTQALVHPLMRVMIEPVISGEMPQISGEETIRSALAAMTSYVTPANAGHVSKLVKNLHLLAGVFSKSDPARYQSLAGSLLRVTQSLPFCLAFCKEMSIPVGREAGCGQGRGGEEEFEAEEEEGARLYHGCAPLLSKMQVHEAMKCGAYLTLACFQPFPSEVVGPLQPYRLAPGLQLQLLDQVLALEGEETGESQGDSDKELRQLLQDRQRRLRVLQAVNDQTSLRPEHQRLLSECLLGTSAGSDMSQVLSVLVAGGAQLQVVWDIASYMVRLRSDGDGEPDSEPSTQHVEDVVVTAVRAVLTTACEVIRQAMADSVSLEKAGADGQGALGQIRGVLDCLDVDASALSGAWGLASGAGMEILNRLRSWVWQTLVQQTDQFSGVDYQMPEASQLLDLQAPLVAQGDHSDSQRWPGWQPPADSGLQQQHNMILNRTVRTLSTATPPWKELRPPSREDIANVAAARQWFTHLAQQCTSRSQWEVLKKLLQDVWREGAAWGDPPISSGTEGARLCVSCLHDCWLTTYKTALRLQLIGEVLRNLEEVGAKEQGVQLTHSDVVELMEDAERTTSRAAAHCIALLSPYEDLRTATLANLIGGDALNREDLALTPLVTLLLARGQWTAPAASTTLLYLPLFITPPHPLTSPPGATSTAALFPMAISQLCQEGQLGKAAALVAQRLRFHPLLSTLDNSLLLLERFLQGCVAGDGVPSDVGQLQQSELPVSVHQLLVLLPDSCRMAAQKVMAIRKLQ